MLNHNRLTIKQVLAIVFSLLIILCLGIAVYQHTHFNRNVKINSIPVGGLAVDKALAKVRGHQREIKVYVNGDLVYQKSGQASGFSSRDKGRIAEAQRKQRTFLPSKKSQNLVVAPAGLNRAPQSAINDAVNRQISQ